MRRIRVIPVLLLVSGGGVVKTVGFKNRTYIGDPVNAVKIFNEKRVDELLILDIDATRENRDPCFDIIEDIVSEAFMPVGFGGGVNSVAHMHRLFGCGIEKVVLATAAVNNPSLIHEASGLFGTQSVVVCLDVKRSWYGKYRLTSHCSSRVAAVSPLEAARRAVHAGAGELIAHAVERDGRYTGYDIALLKSIASAVDVPVVALGGARNVDDFYLAVAEGHCSAVAAGSMFVYQGNERGVLLSYPCEATLVEQLYSKL